MMNVFLTERESEQLVSFFFFLNQEAGLRGRQSGGDTGEKVLVDLYPKPAKPGYMCFQRQGCVPEAGMLAASPSLSYINVSLSMYAFEYKYHSQDVCECACGAHALSRRVL